MNFYQLQIMMWSIPNPKRGRNENVSIKSYNYIHEPRSLSTLSFRDFSFVWCSRNHLWQRIHLNANQKEEVDDEQHLKWGDSTEESPRYHRNINARLWWFPRIFTRRTIRRTINVPASSRAEARESESWTAIRSFSAHAAINRHISSTVPLSEAFTNFN